MIGPKRRLITRPTAQRHISEDLDLQHCTYSYQSGTDLVLNTCLQERRFSCVSIYLHTWIWDHVNKICATQRSGL